MTPAMAKKISCLKLAEIAKQFQQEIKLYDREYRMKSYKDTFLGVEAIDLIERILLRWECPPPEYDDDVNGGNASMATVVYPDEEEEECYRKLATIVAQTIQARYCLFYRAGREKDVDSNCSNNAIRSPIMDEYYIYVLSCKKCSETSFDKTTAIKEEDDEEEEEEDEKESKEEGEDASRPAEDTEDDDFDDKEFFEMLFKGQLDVKEDNFGGDDGKELFDDYIALPEKPDIVREDIDIRRVASILESSIRIKTNRYQGVEFPNTFVGSDAVDVLVDYGMAKSRVDAVKLGRTLATEHKLFHHCPTTTAAEDAWVGNDESSSLQHKSFDDNFYFYRFSEKSEREGLEPRHVKDTINVGTASGGDDDDDYDLEKIAQDLKQNVLVKDRTRHLRTYRKSFVGSQAVSFLVDAGYAGNRIDAVKLGRHLSDERKLFGGKRIDFRDDYEFYSFESASSGDEAESDFSDNSTEIKITKDWAETCLEVSKRMNVMELKRQETLGDVGRGLRWLRSFRRLDPRYRILKHFRTVSQMGEEKPDLKNMNPLLVMWYLSRNRNVFSVWRECKNDAIRKMMCGEAVGKGLDIKGKSAKQGKNAGYVPFLQIGVNKHKYEIDTLSKRETVRVFFHPSSEKQVGEKLVKHAKKMVDRVRKAKLYISEIESKDNDKDNDQEELLENAKKTCEDWDMADPSIKLLDAYKPDCIGYEVPIRLFWDLFFVNQDITRVPGSEYDTQRPSMPKSQDANNKAACSKFKEGCPRPVVWQADEANPFNPQEFLMAYEERGRVLPVASDFDAFLFGTRRFRFDPEEDTLPPEQLQMLHWSVDQIGAVLDIPPRPGCWTKRWQENYARQRRSRNPGSIHYPPYPFGYADQKTKRMVAEAVESLSVDGSVRHGAESFNYFVPQEMDQKFLVVSDCRGTDCKSQKPWYYRTAQEEKLKMDGDDERGMVPWRYMNEQELIQFLSDKIDQGFTFPLSPKWILCDPGWKRLYEKLLASTDEEVMNSMKIWFPPEVRLKIKDISSRHPGGFEGGVLKTQEEVQERFKPILKNDNWVFRKSALGYVRRAVKGEKVVTTTNGTLETEMVVSNDTSLVGFNAAGSSCYVLSKEEFDSSYDVTTLKAIDIRQTPLTPPIAARLINEGYQVCKSKRAVYAHEVTTEDIDWFRCGIPAQQEKDERASFFVAPWGEFTRVEIGDVLVMQFPDGNDEIYRIEHYTFRGTYTPFNDNKRRLMSSASINGLGSSVNEPSKRSSSKISVGSSTSFEGERQRLQIEVKERFLPLLRNGGGIFSKPASSTSYARRARKGETVVTDIAGKQETQNVVEDDTSWIICGKSGEFYVTKDNVFQTRYNVSSARPLNPETDAALPVKLLKEEFQEYNLCAVPMYARKVTQDDLIWFNYGDKEAKFSYFEAPWEAPLRVEQGDMLVTQYHEGNDEVYRVEKIAFEGSYSVHDGQL